MDSIKGVLGVLLAACFISVIAGCGDSAKKTPDTSTAAPEAQAPANTTDSK